MELKKKRRKGQGKGQGFERTICKALSLFVTNGKSIDVFWRSSISGGRATVHRAKGVNIRQAGDICAVAPEGFAFTDEWFVECKNISDMHLSGFLLANVGPLSYFWLKAKQEAHKCMKKPMLIVQSRGPAIVITEPGEHKYCEPKLQSYARRCEVGLFVDMIAAVPAARAIMGKKYRDQAPIERRRRQQ